MPDPLPYSREADGNDGQTMKLLVQALAIVVLAAACAPQSPPTMRFIALGDAPYGDPKEVDPPYRSLIQNINQMAPPLVIHVGDTLGGVRCDNALIDKLRGFMDDFDAPLLYTPGDNEWTDCHRDNAGSFDPLERLSYLRSTYFQTGKTLGTDARTVETQSSQGYPENARLMMNNIGFITAHVVGSNNNFNPRDLDAVKEFMDRDRANIAWLNESFDAFADAEAIVVALHADMFVPTSGFQNGWWASSPFRGIGVTLGKRSSALKKPVLLLYGDSHQHKAFQPFPEHRPYLHAIEVYGHPGIKAIEIAIRPDARTPFEVSKVLNP